MIVYIKRTELPIYALPAAFALEWYCFWLDVWFPVSRPKCPVFQFPKRRVA